MNKKAKNKETLQSYGNLKIILCFSGVVSLLALAVPSNFKPSMSEEEQYQKMLEADQLVTVEEFSRSKEEEKAEVKVEEQLKKEEASNTVVEDTVYDSFKFGDPSFNPDPVDLDNLYPNNSSSEIQNNPDSNGIVELDDDDFFEE